jgi:hypothetical protein
VVKINVIQPTHPTLIAFGIGAAITTAVVGISVLTGDPSHLAYARVKRVE